MATRLPWAPPLGLTCPRHHQSTSEPNEGAVPFGHRLLTLAVPGGQQGAVPISGPSSLPALTLEQAHGLQGSHGSPTLGLVCRALRPRGGTKPAPEVPPRPPGWARGSPLRSSRATESSRGGGRLVGWKSPLY